MELVSLEAVLFGFFCLFVTVNKLITDTMQNTFFFQNCIHLYDLRSQGGSKTVHIIF